MFMESCNINIIEGVLLAKLVPKRYDSSPVVVQGGVAERFKAAVLKTAVGATLP